MIELRIEAIFASLIHKTELQKQLITAVDPFYYFWATSLRNFHAFSYIGAGLSVKVFRIAHPLGCKLSILRAPKSHETPE